jgi:hypothetical protein
MDRSVGPRPGVLYIRTSVSSDTRRTALHNFLHPTSFLASSNAYTKFRAFATWMSSKNGVVIHSYHLRLSSWGLEAGVPRSFASCR